MAETIRIERASERADESGEYVLFKGCGWKYGHIRRWEEAARSEEVVSLLLERIEGWRLLDEAGQEVPYVPTVKAPGKDGKIILNAAALDDLPPGTVRWLVGTAFQRAYRLAGQPDPNA
jgi:hypothetical protein